MIAPARTSSGQCTPTTMRDIATNEAKASRMGRSQTFFVVKKNTPARIKIMEACPDGKEFVTHAGPIT